MEKGEGVQEFLDEKSYQKNKRVVGMKKYNESIMYCKVLFFVWFIMFFLVNLYRFIDFQDSIHIYYNIQITVKEGNKLIGFSIFDNLFQIEIY